MDLKKLKFLLKNGEGTKVDFKLKIDLLTESGRKELAKDVCSIANSKGGRGYLIIGVEDKTRNIIGIENMDYTEEQIQQIVSSRCDPPVPIDIETVIHENKKLLIINIYDGPQKPYQSRDNGAFYIRRGSTTDIMRKQELVSAFQNNLSLNIEACPIVKTDINHLDLKMVDKYFYNQGIIVNDSNRLKLMENGSIITQDKESNDYLITLGGLLVFCKINNVYIPHNMIKIVNSNSGHSKFITGDLLTMLNLTEKYFLEEFPKRYPVNALFEVVKNAVLFRDYTIFNREIEVIIRYSKIYIIIPGAFSKFSEGNYFLQGKRNMWIYEKLLTLDEEKKLYNTGNNIFHIKKPFMGKGKVIFVNSIRENCLKVILPGISRFPE
ncbi:RNA-binding domain-containing protein [Clostridium sp. JN-9]|uniref:AlbA family DNA-binding domain-containing protein n=1 Tax=Clostridium sp. JN-9 TaxID=2507159 RepID=UPI000FFE0B83|nr:RNA-binding domain-containing protein [Clostridium sp. JN-9]QAT39271.1 ATP-binding protein [Clostridium sp. JN-9]